MKQIVKVAEPEGFSRWKRGDRMAHRPNWNRVPAGTREEIHESLMREQGFICCYCEASIVKADSHIEHFRPIRDFSQLQLDYLNLHCSCQRDQSPGEPRHCGHRKGSWFDADLLVSPLDADCEVRFEFTANGDVFPRDDDPAAEKTIQRLGLDLPKLNALRRAAVEALIDLPEPDIQQLLARGTDGRFQQFHTTIRQVLLS